MANFTGFNPTQGKADIESMHSILEKANIDLYNALLIITARIPEVWASPNALEFGKTYGPKMTELKTTFGKNANVIQSNVIRAVQTMANENGFGFFDETADIYVSDYDQENYKEEKDGIVGMNVAQVELYLSTFDEKLNTFYQSFAQVEALDIALYDPNGSLKAAFKSMLTQFENDLNETVTAMQNAIKAAMETETNNIRLAKESAAETMAA